MTNNKALTAHVQILIRRSVAEVFAAITSADVLTKFWLSKSSGPLEPGKRVRWDFMVPGASVETYVSEFELNKRLLIEWSDGTTVAWTLEARGDGTTVLDVANSGFKGTPQEIIETTLESTQGFTIVLCDLKLLLETGTAMNLVRDKALLIEEKLAS